MAKIKEVSSEGFSQELKGFWFFCWLWAGDVMVCFEEGERMVLLLGTSLCLFLQVVLLPLQALVIAALIASVLSFGLLLHISPR